VLNGGKDMKEEGATYGNDICFPGNEVVQMANGATKLLKEVKSGDQVISVDPTTHQSAVVKVKELTVHAAKNYAITQLTLVSAQTQNTLAGTEVKLSGKLLQATPNHPMMTKQGNLKIGELAEGQEVLCLNENTGKYEAFTVLQKTEKAGGSTFLMNGVMVMQK
jgi:3-dehydroquinate synthase class II